MDIKGVVEGLYYFLAAPIGTDEILIMGESRKDILNVAKMEF